MFSLWDSSQFYGFHRKMMNKRESLMNSIRAQNSPTGALKIYRRNRISSTRKLNEIHQIIYVIIWSECCSFLPHSIPFYIPHMSVFKPVPVFFFLSLSYQFIIQFFPQFLSSLFFSLVWKIYKKNWNEKKKMLELIQASVFLFFIYKTFFSSHFAETCTRLYVIMWQFFFIYFIFWLKFKVVKFSQYL